jgi:hypothetical protein
LTISPPYRALGAITLASVAQATAAYFLCRQFGGMVALVIAIPAAMIVYLVALRILAVTRIVDPALRERLISKAPQRMRPVISRIF